MAQLVMQAKQDENSLVWVHYQRFARRAESVRASRQVLIPLSSTPSPTRTAAVDNHVSQIWRV